MSTVGHGGNGLISNIPNYVDLQRDKNAAHEAFVDLVMAKSITKTGTHSGAIYYTDIAASALTWAGRIRPVMGIEAMVGTGAARAGKALTRVQRLADVVAGTWYTDDGSITSSSTLRVYYELSDASDPGSAELMLHLLFNFGTRHGSHPQLGEEMGPDSVFNNWDSSTVLHSWNSTGTGAGGVAISRDTELGPGVRSAFSLKVAPDPGGITAGNSGGANFGGMALEAGREYWFAIDYMTPVDQPSGLVASIRVRGDATNFMLVDGVGTTTSANSLVLDPTYGQPARALFSFRAPSSSAAAVFNVRLLNNSAGTITTGYVKFFRASLKAVFRYLAYDELLSVDSIPDTEVRAASINFGEKTIGFANVSILENSEGSLGIAFGSLFPLRKALTVWSGGFLSSGREILRDDWRSAFRGLVDKVRLDAGQAKYGMQVEDTRTLGYALAAAESVRTSDFANMNTKDGGQSRPLLFGETLDRVFKGLGVDVNASGYRYYEFLDPTIPVRDNVNVGLPTGYAPKIYPSEELADKDELGWELSATITSITVAAAAVVTTSRRHGLATNDQVTLSGTNSTPVIDGRRTVTVITDTTFSVAVTTTVSGNTGKLVSHADIDYSNNNTRWQVKRDLRNFGRDKSGTDLGTDFVLDFVHSSITFATAAIDLSGPGYLVAADLQAAMRAIAGVTNITVVYNESTHKFDFARTGVGNFQILTKTGVNAARMREPIKKILGLDTSADKTGGTSYSSDDPLFTDPDSDHIIRWPGGGYYDDASGTISGVANAPIDNPPAVNSWLLQKRLNIPSSKIYLPSFTSARLASLSGDFAQLLLYIKSANVLEILGSMDIIGAMDTVIDGEGVIRCQRHSDSAPVVRAFFDRDYLSFEMELDSANAYRRVRAWGGFDPTQGRFTTYGDGSGVEDPATEIKFGAVRVFDLDAWLTKSVITGGTQLVANTLTKLFKQCPPTIEFTSQGLLADLLIGDRIQVTAAKAITSTGRLSAVNFRILGVSQNHGTGVGRCLAVQDVTIH